MNHDKVLFIYIYNPTREKVPSMLLYLKRHWQNIQIITLQFPFLLSYFSEFDGQETKLLSTASIYFSRFNCSKISYFDAK